MQASVLTPNDTLLFDVENNASKAHQKNLLLADLLLENIYPQTLIPENNFSGSDTFPGPRKFSPDRSENSPLELVPSSDTNPETSNFQDSLLNESVNAIKTAFETEAPSPIVIDNLFPINFIMGTWGDDTLHGNSEYAWLPDKGLVLTFKEDNIYGLGGNDKIFGHGGDDYISGGEDSDELHGGSGDDLIAGGVGGVNDGIDQMFGGTGADTFLIGQTGVAHYQDVGDDFVELPFIGEVYGLEHYAIIKDFSAEDTLAAPGVYHGTYYTDNFNYSGMGNPNVQDTLIYFGSNDPFLPLDLVAVLVDYSTPISVDKIV